MELISRKSERGVEREPGGGPDEIRVFSTVDVRAVRRFE